jgi:hypothetical protein
MGFDSFRTKMLRGGSSRAALRASGARRQLFAEALRTADVDVASPDVWYELAERAGIERDLAA